MMRDAPTDKGELLDQIIKELRLDYRFEAGGIKTQMLIDAIQARALLDIARVLGGSD